MVGVEVALAGLSADWPHRLQRSWTTKVLSTTQTQYATTCQISDAWQAKLQTLVWRRLCSFLGFGANVFKAVQPRNVRTLETRRT